MPTLVHTDNSGTIDPLNDEDIDGVQLTTTNYESRIKIYDMVVVKCYDLLGNDDTTKEGISKVDQVIADKYPANKSPNIKLFSVYLGNISPNLADIINPDDESAPIYIFYKKGIEIMRHNGVLSADELQEKVSELIAQE